MSELIQDIRKAYWEEAITLEPRNPRAEREADKEQIRRGEAVAIYWSDFEQQLTGFDEVETVLDKQQLVRSFEYCAGRLRLGAAQLALKGRELVLPERRDYLELAYEIGKMAGPLRGTLVKPGYTPQAPVSLYPLVAGNRVMHAFIRESGRERLETLASYPRVSRDGATLLKRRFEHFAENMILAPVPVNIY